MNCKEPKHPSFVRTKLIFSRRSPCQTPRAVFEDPELRAHQAMDEAPMLTVPTSHAQAAVLTKLGNAKESSQGPQFSYISLIIHHC